jgi:hypothetical protein
MAANEIIAEEFRVEQASLEDAYLELTEATEMPGVGSGEER